MQLGAWNPDSGPHTASGTVAVLPVRAETTGFVQTWLEDNRTKYKQVLCSQRWALEDKEKASRRNIQAGLQLLLNSHERVFKSICCSTLKAIKPSTRNYSYLSFKCEKNNNLHFTQVMHTEITAPTWVSSLLSPVTVLWNTLELAKTALSAQGLRTPSIGLSHTASAPYESDKKLLRLKKRALSHRDTQKQQTFKSAKFLKDFCDSRATNQKFKTLPTLLSGCRCLLCVQYRISIYNLLETEKQTLGTRFAGTVTQTTINVRLWSKDWASWSQALLQYHPCALARSLEVARSRERTHHRHCVCNIQWKR